MRMEGDSGYYYYYYYNSVVVQQEEEQQEGKEGLRALPITHNCLHLSPYHHYYYNYYNY